jgi:hypothetical protein
LTKTTEASGHPILEQKKGSLIRKDIEMRPRDQVKETTRGTIAQGTKSRVVGGETWLIWWMAAEEKARRTMTSM